MSLQGPIIVVSSRGRPSFAGALEQAKLFPVIVTPWPDASGAVARMTPAAVLVAEGATEPQLQGWPAWNLTRERARAALVGWVPAGR